MAERSSDKRLLGRRALVTGAAGGQGAAVARQFASEGAVLALTDLPGERLSALEVELRREGAEAKAIAADVRSEQEVQAVVAGAVDFLGGLDVLYNNAGVYWAEKDATVDQLERAIWDEILAINTTSAFLFSKHALSHLLESRDGVLLNVASVAGYAGDAECHAYAASKGALIALTKSIAQRFGSSGLRANVICPGFIATPMVASLLEDEEITRWVEGATALGRVGQPEEVAAVAAFLASSASSFVTASIITVHGGLVK